MAHGNYKAYKLVKALTTYTDRLWKSVLIIDKVNSKKITVNGVNKPYNFKN